MDTVKIGKYLSELRKSKGLTQEALGEQIGVTNKTISRWENGNYMPPVDALQLLSELYGVSINELLSGKKLTDEEYKAVAEENIKSVLSISTFSLKEKVDYYRKKWLKDHMTGLLLQLAAMVILVITIYIYYKNLLPLMIIAGLVCYAINNNRMMSYVEAHAYDGKR